MSQSTREQLEALLAQAPVGGQTAASPIGVPSGFTAERPAGVPYAPGAVQQVPARYFDGDEWAPATAGGPAVAELQRKMIAAGLIPRNARIANGVWDDITRQAFRQVLTYANGTGMTAEMALQALMQSPPTEAAPATLIPDTATVAQTVKTSIRQKLGRDATPEEVARISQVLQGFNLEEAEANVEAQTATGSVAMVDPVARLQQYLEEKYRPEIQRNEGILDLSQSRENLMGSIFAIDEAIAS